MEDISQSSANNDLWLIDYHIHNCHLSWLEMHDVHFRTVVFCCLSLHIPTFLAWLAAGVLNKVLQLLFQYPEYLYHSYVVYC